jgi:ER lumen protein retaining receptor
MRSGASRSPERCDLSLAFSSTSSIRRLTADMLHLLSFVVLLLKINATKSCRGISLKTQELYTLVFVCRYLDLFTNFISL